MDQESEPTHQESAQPQSRQGQEQATESTASASADATEQQSGNGQQRDATGQSRQSQQAQQAQQAQQTQAGQAATAEQQSAEQVASPESVPPGTRLITLFGDLTEIVYAVGAEGYLVARDTSSIYPPAVEELPNMGFAGALNAEAILALEPTLVIGTPMAGPPGVLEQLRSAGVEVLIIEELNGLDAPPIKIRIVGEALSIPQTVEDLALDVERRMAEVMATAAGSTEPLRVLHVLIRRGGLQLVSGEGNKAESIIEAAGGIDAAAEAGIVGWQPLTPEALIAADPDVYLVMDRGLAVVGGVDGLLEIPGMAETNAGQGRRVISMDDLYLLGFGPRLPEAIADLSRFLRESQDEILSAQQ